MNDARVLILGIGNILMGDEGVGADAAQLLARERWPSGTTVIDGGTGGFQLLDALRSHDAVVLIDATMDGQPPGTVSVLHPRYASDFPRALTAHDIGLRDLIETASLLGPLPPITLVTVSIDRIEPMSIALSLPVRAALPLVRAVARQAAAQGVSVMHELGIAAAILEVVQRYVPDRQAALVRRVHIRVGEQTPVLPDSLEFCFSAVVAGTPYASATLDIERVPDTELTIREVELADGVEVPAA